MVSPQEARAPNSHRVSLESTCYKGEGSALDRGANIMIPKDYDLGGGAGPPFHQAAKPAIQHTASSRQSCTIWAEERPHSEGTGFPLRNVKDKMQSEHLLCPVVTKFTSKPGLCGGRISACQIMPMSCKRTLHAGIREDKDLHGYSRQGRPA